MITELARAKVNLTLRVTGRRADGYHMLESLVVFPDIGDQLTLDAGEGLSLETQGLYKDELASLDPNDNLVMRAAEGLRAAIGVTDGAHMSLDKLLPVAAGIGGGSADAAAALRGLVKLWSVTPGDADLQRLAFDLGADVPVCLESRTAVMSGIGEVLKPVAWSSDFWLVLVNCGRPLSTRAVFERLDIGSDRHRLPKDLDTTGSFSELIEDIRSLGNDLEEPAIELEPEIQTCLDNLNACDDIVLARMSGSGATCFGLFKDEAAARRSEATLATRHPAWWVCAAKVA